MGAQFIQFKIPSAHHASATDGAHRRLDAFEAFEGGDAFIQGSEAVWAAVITVVAFLVSLFLPRLTQRVPSALVAIIIGTGIEWAIVRTIGGTRTTTVDDVAGLHGSLPSIAWLDREYTMPPLNVDPLRTILPTSVSLAAVGLLESLMSLNLIDEITLTKGSTVRECIGQGVANVICGVLGGMGGCAMLGQSMININSGARTRLSSATAGVVLLLVVLVAYPAINIIPTSALVGVMFNVVVHTFEWRSLKLMLLAAMPLRLRRACFSEVRSQQKIRRADALVILIVTVITLVSDLAIAVGVGVAVSCAMFVFDSASLISASSRGVQDATTGQTTKFYDIHGVLFFGSCTQFLALFNAKEDPNDVRLVFQAGFIADYSAIEALNKLGERYGAYGKRVRLQQLKPGSGRVVNKASGLLVKELEVSMESDELLPAEREHLNVERWRGDETSRISRTGDHEEVASPVSKPGSPTAPSAFAGAV